ncbi:hypothetical protein V496_01595 [Pseudogymnoascus sp. VKM F-4515 (FW-2607)]|nr:hypothetical protein V496_01595 [Pseudogymnoascus sp. VKM F-4515 (FW-2607)]
MVEGRIHPRASSSNDMLCASRHTTGPMEIFYVSSWKHSTLLAVVVGCGPDKLLTTLSDFRTLKGGQIIVFVQDIDYITSAVKGHCELSHRNTASYIGSIGLDLIGNIDRRSPRQYFPEETMSANDTAQQQRMQRTNDDAEQAVSGQTDEVQRFIFEDLNTAEDAHLVIVSTATRGNPITARNITTGARTSKWLGQIETKCRVFDATWTRAYTIIQRTIRGLKEELEALNEVLQSLHATISNGKVDLTPLTLPLTRCNQACQEFEAMVLKCTKHSNGTRRSLRDWTTLTYMGGDITAFKNMLGGYKSTIAIALGDANIRTTNVTISLLDEYNTMIANTTSDLKEHLQELDAKLQAISQGAQAFNVDDLEEKRIKEERESAQSCLDICIQVSAHIDDVQQNAFVNIVGTSANNQDSAAESKKFTLAEAVTNNTLNHCKLGLAQTTSQLREQLHRINDQMRSSQRHALSGEQAIEQERIREELRSVEQSLKICSEAAEKALPDRIHVFEDVSMADDGDQIIVATFGDLISAKRVTVGSRSRQFLGQMSDTSLQQLSQRIGRGPLEVDVDQSTRTNSPFEGRYGTGRPLNPGRLATEKPGLHE